MHAAAINVKFSAGNSLTISKSVNESFGSGRQCAEEMRCDEINFNQIGGLDPWASVI